MIDEFKKSVNATLYERTTSPLFGTFFFSWIVWNWKIILVVFFTATKDLKLNNTPTTKFQYIESKLIHWDIGLVFPLISTLLILTLYSWLALLSYRLWLYFDNEKNRAKNTIEKAKFLTIEQSMKLRLEIATQEDKFVKMLEEKENLILALKNENEELYQQNYEFTNKQNSSTVDKQTAEFKIEMDKFFSNESLVKSFSMIMSFINANLKFDSSLVSEDVAMYFVAHGIIDKHNESTLYFLTDKGRIYMKEYVDKKIKFGN